MSTNSSFDTAVTARPQLRKSLKLWQVVMMGLAYLTPMTVFDTFGIVSGVSNGHVPASYLLALAGVLFTAISYGKLFQSVFLCTTFINTLASGLASHASVSRLLYVMGRDRVFPERVFGYVHPKWRTPALNVIMVGIVALSAQFFNLVTATALINFGTLVGAATVAVLWINLEATSLTLGLVWAALGLLYLSWLTRRFRQPPPQYDAAKAERAMD